MDEKWRYFERDLLLKKALFVHFICSQLASRKYLQAIRRHIRRKTTRCTVPCSASPLRCSKSAVDWKRRWDDTNSFPVAMKFEFSLPTSHKLLAKIAAMRNVWSVAQILRFRSCVWLLPITPKNWHLRCVFQTSALEIIVNPSFFGNSQHANLRFPYWFKDFQLLLLIWRYLSLSLTSKHDL